MKKIILIFMLTTTLFTVWLTQNKTEAYAYFTNPDSYFGGQVTYSNNDAIFFESSTNEFLPLKNALASYIGFGNPSNTKVIVSYSFVPANIMIDDAQLRDVINITTVISFNSPLYFAEFDLYFFDVYNDELYTIHYNSVGDLNNMVFDSIVINSVTGTYQQGYSEGYGVGYIDGYNTGYSTGTSVSQSEAYNTGYNDGTKDTFYANLDAWVVPLAIVVAIASIGIVYLKWKPKTGE